MFKKKKKGCYMYPHLINLNLNLMINYHYLVFQHFLYYRSCKLLLFIYFFSCFTGAASGSLLIHHLIYSCFDLANVTTFCCDRILIYFFNIHSSLNFVLYAFDL